MGRVTVLLSGVPTHVTLFDLSYYLEDLFYTNSEIGTFEIRHLPRKDNNPLVALDFHSGFDAIAAQAQLDGYQCEMQDGNQYILRAKITNKREFLREDSSPECSWKRSRSSSMENEAWRAWTLTPTMSDGAVFRANAKLDAKYKLLQKQKLILQTEMQLIKERRKLRREYMQQELLDSDDDLTCYPRKPKSKSTSREHRSFSRELELFKIRQAAKIQELKATDCHAIESSSFSKRRSPSWDIEAEAQSRSVKSKPSSRERRLREYRSRSRVRSRVYRSRSLTQSPIYKSKSRERSLKNYGSNSRVSSKAARLRSQTRSPARNNSRSRSSSPRNPRSRARVRRSRESRYQDRTRRISEERERSRHRNKRLRSPESGSRSRRSRSQNRGSRLLAIMPKSPLNMETSIVRKQSNKLENSKITEKKILKDTLSEIDSVDKKKDAKNSLTKKETAQRKKVKNEETVIQSICDDIMFLTQSLLLEISIKENIKISQSNARLMKEKLNTLIQERVKILREDEKFSVLNVCENYRKICTKQDDTLLLKKMLDDLNKQEADLTVNQNISSVLVEATNDIPENTIRKNLNVDQAAVTHDGTEENVKNKDQIIQRYSLESEHINKAEEVTEIIDIETYCPEVSLVIEKKAAPKKKKPIPTPQFVLVIKKLMKQLKPVIKRSREKGVYVNYFNMKQVLRIVLADVLKGEGYKTTTEIVNLFRQRYPRYNDVAFVKKIEEDINLKKYDLDGTDKGCQDDDDGDVILVESKSEVVTIEDSEDEPDDIRERIMSVIFGIDGFTEIEKMHEVMNDLSGIEMKEAINSIIKPKDNEKTSETVNSILEPKEENAHIQSEKINEADNSIEPTEICNTIVKQEEEGLVETVQNEKTAHIYASSNSLEPIHADTTLNLEVQQTETEFDHITEERTQERLKVTAITIMTSETELHSIATAIANKDEDPDEKIKEELDPELTDADIDKILSLDNFSLDMPNLSDANEKETPQVTSITIMTSASELFLLNNEDNENTTKEVPDVKVENNEVLDDVNESDSNTASVGILYPESQDKHKRDEEEEETIESICKYVSSFCNDL